MIDNLSLIRIKVNCGINAQVRLSYVWVRAVIKEALVNSLF